MTAPAKRPFPDSVTVAGEEYEVRLSLLAFRRLGEKYGGYYGSAGTPTRWSVHDPAFLTDALALIVGAQRGKPTTGDWIADHLDTPLSEASKAMDRALCHVLRIGEFAAEEEPRTAEGTPDPEASGAS